MTIVSSPVMFNTALCTYMLQVKIKFIYLLTYLFIDYE